MESHVSEYGKMLKSIERCVAREPELMYVIPMTETEYCRLTHSQHLTGLNRDGYCFVRENGEFCNRWISADDFEKTMRFIPDDAGTSSKTIEEFLIKENRNLLASGNNLASAAARVVSSSDGVHRLAFAVSEWFKTLANSGGRKNNAFTSVEQLTGVVNIENNILIPQEEYTLRKLLALVYSGANLYGDDGELQDNLRKPCIDFLRDSASDIRAKIEARSCAELSQAHIDGVKSIDVQNQAVITKLKNAAQDTKTVIVNTLGEDNFLLRSFDKRCADAFRHLVNAYESGCSYAIPILANQNLIVAYLVAYVIFYGTTRRIGEGSLVVPGINHSIEVFRDVHNTSTFSWEVSAAALLHDVIEECKEAEEIIRVLFPNCDVLKFVKQLTNEIPANVLPRAKRMSEYCDKIKQSDNGVRYIKAVDRLNNLRTIRAGKGKAFAKLYATESQILLDNALHGVDTLLGVDTLIEGLIQAEIDKINAEL